MPTKSEPKSRRAGRPRVAQINAKPAPKALHREVKILVLIAVGILLTLCVFVPNSIGFVGRFFASILFGLLGFGAFVLPLTIIGISVFALKYRRIGFPIGLIIAMVANMFMGSSSFDLLIIIGGLVIFLGLVAADTNKIKNHFAYVALHGNDEENAANGIVSQEALASNLAIVGALMLYLDFINIFMFILRLMARRR